MPSESPRPSAPAHAPARLDLTHEAVLDAAPEAVFPLLCPVREYDWIPSWACGLVHSASGLAEPDCVFVTEFPDRGREVWTCSRFDPPARIEYVRMGPGRVTRLEIRLAPEGPGTRIRWRQVITALDAAEAEAVEEYGRTRYPEDIRALVRMLAHHLATGGCLGRD
ncbi:MAG: SRPBCC domain-containing protein [Desulfovibrionaceae bacterium]